MGSKNITSHDWNIPNNREAFLRYKAIADFSPGIICETDLDLRIIYMNRYGLRTFGLQEEDLGLGISAFDLIHNDCKEKARRGIKDLLKGKQVNISEYSLLKKDGSVFQVLINGVPLLWQDETVGFRFSATDVTRINELQVQIRESQKMKALAVLAGGIAHKFNNLLSSFTLNLDLLEMKASEDTDFLKRINMMREVTGSMVQLTNQFIAFAGNREYTSEVIPLNELIYQTISILDHQFTPDIKLTVDFPEQDYYIKGDKTRLHVVITSIISNSLESIEERGYIRITGEKISVNADNREKYPVSETGDYILLEIQDDGKGMHKDTLDRIFEPFFTTKFQGRGLGLSAAYGIIKNHHGWIEADSELGRGTIVRIGLPIAEEQIQYHKQMKLGLE